MAKAKVSKKFLIGMDPGAFVDLKDYMIDVNMLEVTDAKDETVIQDLFYLPARRGRKGTYAKVDEVTEEKKFLVEFTAEHFRDIEKMLEKYGAKIKSDEDVVRKMFHVTYDRSVDDEDEIETLDLSDEVTVREIT